MQAYAKVFTPPGGVTISVCGGRKESVFIRVHPWLKPEAFGRLRKPPGGNCTARFPRKTGKSASNLRVGRINVNVKL